MDILKIIEMDNQTILKKLINMNENPNIVKDDRISEFTRLFWRVLAEEEAKRKTLYGFLKDEGHLGPEIRELEDFNREFRRMLTDPGLQQLEHGRRGEKISILTNLFQNKVKKELAIIEKARDILDEKIRSQMVTTYERFRELDPEISTFQEHDPPMVLSPREKLYRQGY